MVGRPGCRRDPPPAPSGDGARLTPGPARASVPACAHTTPPTSSSWARGPPASPRRSPWHAGARTSSCSRRAPRWGGCAGRAGATGTGSTWAGTSRSSGATRAWPGSGTSWATSSATWIAPSPASATAASSPAATSISAPTCSRPQTASGARAGAAGALGGLFGDAFVDVAMRPYLEKIDGLPLERIIADRPLRLMREQGAPDGFWFPAGGIGRLMDAMADAARAEGARIEMGTPVAGIEVSEGRATGVRLGPGERDDRERRRRGQPAAGRRGGSRGARPPPRRPGRDWRCGRS